MHLINVITWYRRLRS